MGLLTTAARTLGAPAGEEIAQDVRRSLAFLGFAVLFFWGGLYVFVPILPLHAAQLGASMTGVGGVVAAYGIPQLLIRIPLGIWSDRAGSRKPFVAMALVLSAAGAIMLGVAPDPLWLALARALTGVAASYWVVLTVLYAAHFSHNASVKAMGRANAITSLAQFLSFGVGGFVASSFGLQAVFFTGAILAVAGLVALLGVVDVRPAHEESRAALPTGMHTGDLVRSSTIAALVIGVGFATTFGFVPVLASKLGAAPELLGAVTAARVLALAVAALAVDWLSRRVGDRTTIVLGLAILGITTWMSADAQDFYYLTALQIVGGLGYGIVTPLTMGMAIRGTESGSRATAMGIYQAVYCVGMVGMPAIAGVVADANGLPWVFYLCALVCLGAIGIAFTVGRERTVAA